MVITIGVHVILVLLLMFLRRATLDAVNENLSELYCHLRDLVEILLHDQIVLCPSISYTARVF